MSGSSPSEDITGSIVTSDKPVAVFNSYQSRELAAGGDGRAGIAQLPPTDAWGRDFFVAPFSARDEDALIRILASTDETHVTLDGSEVATLERGQSRDQIVLTGASRITSDKPILVAQYAVNSTTEPPSANSSMMLVTPTGQFLKTYTLATPAIGFAHNFINMIAPPNAVGEITLDGVPVAASNFTDSDVALFSVATLETSGGAHRLSASAPFGVSVYGFNERDSYSFPGGMGMTPPSRPDGSKQTAVEMASAAATTTAATSTCGDLVAVVRHAPTLTGRVKGSVQQLNGEDVNFNSGNVITSDLLVPGTPTVQINGTPNYQGTVDGTGSTQPTGYRVTLNSGSQLRHLVRRTNPVVMTTVPVPPATTGTRYVTADRAGYNVGNWATVRDLTLNSGVGSVIVPAGTYNNFTANDHATLVFGVAGATTPSIYNLDTLTLNSNAGLQLLGPVVINVGSRATINSGVDGIGSESALARAQRGTLRRDDQQPRHALRRGARTVRHSQRQRASARLG